MDKDEALKLAQKAMMNSNSISYEMLDAITAIKEALEQPAQDWKTLPKKDAPLVEWANEQTPPKRPWVGLTDEEIESALPGYRAIDALDIYHAIEARLKEKQ